MTDKITIVLTLREWEILRDGIADIACWHYGFAEAKPDYYGPPQLKEVIDLVSSLKRKVNDQTR